MPPLSLWCIQLSDLTLRLPAFSASWAWRCTRHAFRRLVTAPADLRTAARQALVTNNVETCCWKSKLHGSLCQASDKQLHWVYKRPFDLHEIKTLQLTWVHNSNSKPATAKATGPCFRTLWACLPAQTVPRTNGMLTLRALHTSKPFTGRPVKWLPAPKTLPRASKACGSAHGFSDLLSIALPIFWIYWTGGN